MADEISLVYLSFSECDACFAGRCEVAECQMEMRVQDEKREGGYAEDKARQEDLDHARERLVTESDQPGSWVDGPRIFTAGNET